MYNYQTSGFIIDYRINYGGTLDFEYKTYKLLFNETVYTIGYDERTDPEDHFGMTQSSWATPYNLRVPGNPNSYYDKPIAILIGPGTVSAGDVESVRMSFHPMVRFFGKPSSGAFTISRYPDLGHPDWFCYLAIGSAYLVSNHEYLCHTGVNVDEDVWLSQEGVVSGVDDVAEAAINWINGYTGINNLEQKSATEIYPVPTNDFITLNLKGAILKECKLQIFDISGKKLFYKLINPSQNQQTFTIDINNFSQGLYFLKISSENYLFTHKIIKT